MLCMSLVWIDKHTTAGHLLEIMSTSAVRQVNIINIGVVKTFTLLFASTTEEKYPTLYSLAVVAERNNSCKQLQEEAKTVAMLFEKLFSKFAACHNHYSVTQKLSKDDISQLSKLIRRLEFKQAHFLCIYINCRLQHSRFSCVLLGILPRGKHHTKNAHARRPHNSMARAMQTWLPWRTRPGIGPCRV